MISSFSLLLSHLSLYLSGNFPGDVKEFNLYTIYFSRNDMEKRSIQGKDSWKSKAKAKHFEEYDSDHIVIKDKTTYEPQNNKISKCKMSISYQGPISKGRYNAVRAQEF